MERMKRTIEAAKAIRNGAKTRKNYFGGRYCNRCEFYSKSHRKVYQHAEVCWAE